MCFLDFLSWTQRCGPLKQAAAMNVKLVVIGGKNAGRAIPVGGPKFFIGRGEDCHLRPNSDLVSRHHCAITVLENTVTVRDFGSRNGTLVNEERIEGEHELRSGDRLRVGPLLFEVLLEVGLAGQKKPKVQSLQEAAARTVGSAAKPADEELDIAGWVGEQVDGKADTKSLTDAHAGTVAMNTPAAAPVAENKAEDKKPPSPPAAQPEPQKKPPVKSASSAPGAKKPKSADSQSAAAETLRAFFNRK
ncbi:MAG TPA: FHA domain-containing protein [Thermoguttaceae bacterium]|nr:FHA domain-containing protein [Thermoguttaceae bacterium]